MTDFFKQFQGENAKDHKNEWFDAQIKCFLSSSELGPMSGYSRFLYVLSGYVTKRQKETNELVEICRDGSVNKGMIDDAIDDVNKRLCQQEYNYVGRLLDLEIIRKLAQKCSENDIEENLVKEEEEEGVEPSPISINKCRINFVIYVPNEKIENLLKKVRGEIPVYEKVV